MVRTELYIFSTVYDKQVRIKKSSKEMNTFSLNQCFEI